ncbi:zinc-binding dehydrogenase [Actinoplanes rectilineatus]|uniref:zinc-binding dehydrogenase n=1 Tax=Actinoplanes rectilineatus TaxID=113571 RepID=UPI001FE23E86|nr:zinc-binding dehydrogenase [Actinoplanes rectilineatus]
MTEFGGPESMVPGDAPEPDAGPGQVVVDVAVAGMTFVETQIRRGVDRWHERPPLPYVPGGLVAGVVTTVGERVDPAWRGRRVVTMTGDTGGFAERAVAAEEDLFPVPDGVSLAEAAALYSDGSTAQGLVERAGIVAGDRVLVEAAAGGLGTLLVQLCLAAGAQVAGAARGPRKLEVVRGLGADAVVDYAEPGWAERVFEAKGPSVVFDGVGGRIGRAAFEVTARGGRFSVHGASSGDVTAIDAAQARERGIQVIGIEQLFDFRAHMRRWATEILAHAAAGTVRPVIGQTFPLERAADAHRAVEDRTALGKTLLLVRTAEGRSPGAAGDPV